MDGIVAMLFCTFNPEISAVFYTTEGLMKISMAHRNSKVHTSEHTESLVIRFPENGTPMQLQ